MKIKFNSNDDLLLYFHWYKNKQLDLKKYVSYVEYSKSETLIY